MAAGSSAGTAELTGTTKSRAAITVFFVVTFTFTWSCWFVMVAHDDRQWLHFAGSLGPAIGAIVAVGVAEGIDGLKQLGRRIVRWRVPARVWGIALLLPVALYATGTLISGVIGKPVPWWRFLSTDELGQVGPVLIVLEIVFFGLGEETGWRGFLLPRLELAGRTPYAASTMFIPVWALWHLPLFFYAYGLGDMSPLMIPGWLVSIALSTYLISWLFHSSHQSVLVVAVFHGMVDLVSITSASSTIVLVMINAGLIAASILVTTRSRVLFRATSSRMPGADQHPA